MKTTRYFQEQVLLKRPYLKREWCQEAIAVLTSVWHTLTFAD